MMKNIEVGHWSGSEHSLILHVRGCSGAIDIEDNMWKYSGSKRIYYEDDPKRLILDDNEVEFLEKLNISPIIMKDEGNRFNLVFTKFDHSYPDMVYQARMFENGKTFDVPGMTDGEVTVIQLDEEPSVSGKLPAGRTIGGMLKELEKYYL